MFYIDKNCLMDEDQFDREYFDANRVELVCLVSRSNIFLFLVLSPDYLNNLSPDSKEYEDTQGRLLSYHSCGPLTQSIVSFFSVTGWA